MRTEYKFFFAVVVTFLGVALLWRGCGNNRMPSRGAVSKTPTALPSNIKEKVSYNEKTHTLTIQTHTPSGQTKTITEYAKNPVIELEKNGKLDVQRHLTGIENEPFLGGGYADTGRLFVGDNVFHIGRFDLMGAVGWTPDSRYTAFKVYTGVSYSVYSNTSVGLGADIVSLATGTPLLLGFVSVKL